MSTIALMTGCDHSPMLQFSLTDPATTGISFVNKLEEDGKYNILAYEYTYNGGGVSAADFNNDGLQDLFFTGNRVPNALYLNQGNWKFVDITSSAGVKGRNDWKTGTTTVDINNDGLLDIYVCYSGPGSDESRANQLFVNNGGASPTFTEAAAAYGLDAVGTYSTQASFFDYDLDGDLDMFLLNHAKITYSPFFNSKKLRAKRHPRFGNRLYKNTNGKFEDASEETGIHGSAINFGLGVSVSDLNNDGWPDLYVTNDYEEQDYFYLNRHDGTFRECLKQSFRHIARFGMGSDIADYNNDGLADVFVVDMLPHDNYRSKLLKGPDEYDKYMLLRDSGYHHQNMRNMLQLNLGTDRNGVPIFSEVGQLAGASSTDWSWAPLWVDLDNDGLKDLFVTNGYLKDFTNMDFLKYAFGDYKKLDERNPMDTMALLNQIPVTKLSNYCFLNRGDLLLDNVAVSWGLDHKAMSNGATFADLDNDGDQDLVVNNINDVCSIYRNNSETTKQHHWIKIRLAGDDLNRFSVGAKVRLNASNVEQMQEHFPTRGFQSSVPHELVFGVGSSTSIDSLTIQWPDQSQTTLRNVGVDTVLLITYSTSERTSPSDRRFKNGIFEEMILSDVDNFRHSERPFIDHKIQFLLPYQLSSNGPCLVKADVDRDGQEDFYVGGGRGQSGKLFLGDGQRFHQSKSAPWESDKECEDTDAHFFDADNDGDLDLYVVSGSAEYSPEENTLLQDRLYINDGKGSFSKAVNVLPKEKSNGACVASADFDKDGDLDLFVGGRNLPGYFPLPSRSYLLRNDSKSGEVIFKDVTPEFLSKEYIITSAVWSDTNGDMWMDLVFAGEFSPVVIAVNKNGKFVGENVSEIPHSSGLWSELVAADIDMDGDEDFVVGNVGVNMQFHASINEPIMIHYHDFNEDGKMDPILSSFTDGVSWVYPSRDEMLEQLPHLKKKFIKYADYAGAAITDLLDDLQLKKARVIKAVDLRSSIVVNHGAGKFTLSPLPNEAQFSRVNGIIVHDFTHDSIPDVLLSGNFYPYRVQLGRSDAGTGLLLKGKKNGYEPLLFKETGFKADGDVRSMVMVSGKNSHTVVCGVNDEYLKFFKTSK